MKDFQPDSRSIGKSYDPDEELSHLDVSYGEGDAPPGDDVEELIWHRSADFKKPAEFQARVDRLLAKYQRNQLKERKIKAVVKKTLAESNFISSIEYWFRDKIRDSEEIRDVINEFTRLLSQWSNIGLDKKTILESKVIREMAAGQLLDSMKTGPSYFPSNFRIWLQAGIPCKDFLDSAELQEEIDSQIESIAKYDKKRSLVREKEWAYCINRLR